MPKREHYVVLATRFPEETYHKIMPFSEEEVRSILRVVRKKAPEAQVIGSWGIVLSAPKILENYHPHDLDILIPAQALKSVVQVLKDKGFRVARPYEIGHLIVAPIGEGKISGTLYVLPRTIGSVNLLRDTEHGIQAVELIPDTGISLYTGIRTLPPNVRGEKALLYEMKQFSLWAANPPETGILLEHFFPRGIGAIPTTVAYKLLRFAPRDRVLLLELAKAYPEKFLSYVKATLNSPAIRVHPLQLYASLGWLKNLVKPMDKTLAQRIREAQAYVEGYLRRMGVDMHRALSAGFYRLALSSRGRLLSNVRIGLRPAHKKYLLKYPPI